MISTSLTKFIMNGALNKNDITYFTFVKKSTTLRTMELGYKIGEFTQKWPQVDLHTEYEVE